MWCLWSSKGGVGCTVVAVEVARRSAAVRPTLLVDLAGDVPAVLGHRSGGFGIADWLVSVAPPPDALARIEVDVGPGLTVLPWRGDGEGSSHSAAGPAAALDPDIGRADLWADPAETLARMIALDHRAVVVDLGKLDGLDGPPAGPSPTPRSSLAGRLLALATRSTLVIRPCHLAVRSAEAHPSPDDVIVVGHGHRSFGTAEVQSALSAPVVASLRWDPAVARAVSSGLGESRSPRSLRPLAALGGGDVR